jgi:hypothetical protein
MVKSSDFCAERLRLVNEFGFAIKEHDRLQAAQIEALRRREGFLFEQEILEARTRGDEAMKAIVEHEYSHRCTTHRGTA